MNNAESERERGTHFFKSLKQPEVAQSVDGRERRETARLSDGEGRITGCNGNEVSTRLITVQTMQRSLLIDDDMLESIFAHITPALPRAPSARVVHVLTGAPYAITGSAAAARARQQGLA